ncbi:unnamed protein product, partial [Notodromas monacha]
MTSFKSISQHSRNESGFSKLLRFVPDIIVKEVENLKHYPHFIEYSGAMTLMDISGSKLLISETGFTALTDEFTQGHLHQGGTSSLSGLLNEYLRKILGIVFAHEGDVTNFA